MQQDMRLRDQALKKVPSNTAQLLKEIKQQADEATKRVDEFDAEF